MGRAIVIVPFATRLTVAKFTPTGRRELRCCSDLRTVAD